MLTYLIVNAVTYGCLCIMWKKSDNLNLFIKIVLFFMTIASLFFAAVQAGFVVQIS